MSGLGTLMEQKWSLMVNCLCYSLFMFTWSCVYGLMLNLLLHNWLKRWPIKANHSKPVSAFWASWTPCYVAEYNMYLRLLYFSILWIKILDGYQIASLELGLWSTNQLPLWIWSLRLKIGVVFPLSILSCYIPYTNTLCNKCCLLILPLFVAICEIWLPGLTYSVYLVLSLKPGATKWYQSNADCRT